MFAPILRCSPKYHTGPCSQGVQQNAHLHSRTYVKPGYARFLGYLTLSHVTRHECSPFLLARAARESCSVPADHRATYTAGVMNGSGKLSQPCYSLSAQ